MIWLFYFHLLSCSWLLSWLFWMLVCVAEEGFQNVCKGFGKVVGYWTHTANNVLLRIFRFLYFWCASDRRDDTSGWDDAVVCLSILSVFKHFLFFLFQGFICIFILHHVTRLSCLLFCVQYDSCSSLVHSKVCDIVCVFLICELMASASELFILMLVVLWVWGYLLFNSSVLLFCLGPVFFAC